MHTSRRNYAASGGAAGADIPTIAGQAAANPMTVNGTVYTAPGIHKPPTVSVSLVQASTSKGTQTANVNQGTGAFSATIPGGSATAGAGVTVQVVGTSPVFTTTSNTFTLT
jgi:hypothetical protein